MHNEPKRDRWVSALATALTLNLFLLRPSALGNRYSTVGMAIAAVVVGLYSFGVRREFRPRRLPRHIGVLAALIFAYWIYESTLVVFHEGSNDVITYLKEVGTLAVVLLCYGIPLSNRQFNELFFRRFCTILALLGLSCAVTLVLAYFLGLDRLQVTQVDIKGYDTTDIETGLRTGTVFFPFSMVYARFRGNGIELFRFSGFFREAGIFQAFCCFGFAYEAFTTRRRWVLVGAVVGSIAAFSTLGLATLLLTFGTVYAFRRPGLIIRRAIGTAVLVTVALIAAVYTPYIGLVDKALSHTESISDRRQAVDQSIDSLVENPIGNGPFPGATSNEHAGINLLAQAGHLGLLGFVLQITLIVGWRGRLDRHELLRVSCCMPIAITALVAQPLTGAPLVYLMTMASIPLLDMGPLEFRNQRLREGFGYIRSSPNRSTSLG